MLVTFIQYSAILIPLGFVIVVCSAGYFKGWVLYIGLICGIVLVLMGMVALYFVVKLSTLEEIKNDRKFDSLMEEIKGLRQDLTGCGNERNKKPDK